MSLAPGARLGPYEIIAAIGAGGMGEVYRARDPRLGREVAIKVISASFSGDPDRLNRFEQEARAAAALNHPNIVAVYDVGAHEGAPYVVSELLEGQTLRERLAGSAALPVRKAIEYAVGLARGLAAAHEKGIVHRDLKPENIFVTSDGQVKILDFGLAKLTQADPMMGASSLPTTPPNTQPGLVLGTLGYMAPEQVRGLAVDARADIFAFGAVLYELLTGHQAFKADTAADTMFAIVKEEPPQLTATRADLSPALDRIVRHCLEKNAAERFQSARDVAFALEALSGSEVSSSPPTAREWSLPGAVRVSKMSLAALIVGVVLIGAVAFFAGKRVGIPDAATLPQWEGQLLGGPTVSFGPRISPDGQMLAFQALVDGLTQVAVMKPQSGDWTILTSDRTRGQVQHVSWSSDGAKLFFDRFFELPGGIFSVPSVARAIQRASSLEAV